MGVWEGWAGQEQLRDMSLNWSRGITTTKEGTGQEGVEMMGSKVFSASFDIRSRSIIMAGFLSCRNASTDMQSRRAFFKDTGNS